MRLHVHLKKFKLLYLLNHMSYFNKICRIYGLNAYVQMLYIWWKNLLQLQRYGIFYGIIFFIGAPCTLLCVKVSVYFHLLV